MKKIAIAFFAVIIAVITAYSSLNANFQIMNMTVDGKKVHAVERDGKKVDSCSYCHTDAGFKQAKNNYLMDQENYYKLAEIPGCAGSGCHVK